MKSLMYELEVTAKQDKYVNWMYSKIKPYIKGNVLEVGSGIGTFSEKIIEDTNGGVYLTDIRTDLLKLLKKKFKQERVKILYLDLNHLREFVKLGIRFDTIVSINVLEHIEEDRTCMWLLKCLLNKGGRIVMYVPCNKFLFCHLDVEEGHFRRYSKRELEELASESGLKIEKAFWFNLFGIPARYIIGNILGVSKSPSKSFGFYNLMTPIFKFIEEKILFNCWGVGRILVLK